MSEADSHPPHKSVSIDQLADYVPAARGRRLYTIGLAATATLMVGCALKTPHEDVILTALGLAMIGFAVWPALLWARDNRPWFPAFEMYVGTTLVFHAIPFFSRTDISFKFSPKTVVQSALEVITFQLVALLVFRQTRGRPARSSPLLTPVIPRYLAAVSTWGVWLNVAYIWMETFTHLLPPELMASARALFFGIGLVAAFIQSWKWGVGQLSRSDKISFTCAVVAQIILSTVGLRLIGVMTLLAMISLSYVAASRRLPIVALAVALPILAILQNGKYQMRNIYWNADAEIMTLEKIPERYAEWFHYGLQLESGEGEMRLGRPKSGPGLMERASLFQMLALVVENVPDRDPYLSGTSYIDIPAVIVPRLLWPNKPSSLQANVRLALHLGLVDERNAQSVSIAFGPLAEAHANFGWIGVVGLAAVMGYVFKRACTLAVGAPLFSAAGLFVILLGAWSCQAELIMATWVASLFQATLVVVAGPMLMRRLLGS